MPTSPAVELNDVRVEFSHRPVLDGLTLQALPGEVTAILGPNGAGKTTMIRCCVGGLVKPSSGRVELLGLPAGDPGLAARVGLMPQTAGAWAGVRPAELLDYLAKLHANPVAVPRLLAEFGIDEFARTPYRRLSGGQQQLVNLAAALVGRPEVVFLDEPTAGMDPHVRRQTWGLIKSLRQAGLAVVLTTHAMDEAAALADRVWIIDRGVVKVHGTVPELTAEASLEEVFLANTSKGRP